MSIIGPLRFKIPLIYFTLLLTYSLIRPIHSIFLFSLATEDGECTVEVYG